MLEQPLKLSRRHVKNVKSVVEDEFIFPIGSILTEVSIVEDREYGGKDVCLEQVQLSFQDTAVILKPLADTDEIEVVLGLNAIADTSATAYALESPNGIAEKNPEWSHSFLGKKLQTVWVCENAQGYRDQIIFAFEQLHPSIAFVAECSVLNVFRFEQIQKVNESSIKNLQSNVI